MKTKKDILFLAKNGLSSPVISSFSDRQVKILVEKFKKLKKQENKEQVTPITEPAKTSYMIKGPGELPNNPSGKGYEVEKTTDGIKATPMESEVTEDDTLNIVQDPDATEDGMGIFETEITEKFESKDQQGLFWARCNKCSSKNCKWCKMAKEFSDSTSKKQYKKMPEKKHPKKTVKTKTEKTNENFQKFLEEKIAKMVDEKIEPKMKKKDLVKTIKKKVKNNDSMILRNPKKLTMFSDEAPMNLPIGQMFSIGKK